MSLSDPFGDILSIRQRQQEEGDKFVAGGLSGLGQTSLIQQRGKQTQDILKEKAYLEEEKINKQREVGANLLRQMGILKPEPLTLKDYENYAKENNINIDYSQIPDASEERKLKIIQNTLDLTGIPHPKPKSEKVDLLEASKIPGLSIDLLKGSVSTKTPTVKQTMPDKKIADIGDAIISGKQPPELTRLYGAAKDVRAYLADKGFDLTKAQTEWTATSNYVKNLNSTQQLRLGQALTSVKSSIDPLRNLSDEFTRTNLTPANWVQLQLAMKTGDPTATKMVAQINLMRDELAQAFMAGGVPTERALELVKEILQPVYGGQQMDAALDQLSFNLNIRENAINSMRPRTIGGELETGRPGSNIKGITDVAGLTSKTDEQKVQAYMKKYPNRSREEIIRAMGK